MDYYTQQTKPILDNVLNFLSADPRRRFIYAELSFFSLWWESLSESRKQQARKLVFPIITPPSPPKKSTGKKLRQFDKLIHTYSENIEILFICTTSFNSSYNILFHLL